MMILPDHSKLTTTTTGIIQSLNLEIITTTTIGTSGTPDNDTC